MKALFSVAILSQQEDYVKWKGPLFFRFITALVDEDIQIRKFGMTLDLTEDYNLVKDLAHS